MEKESVSIPIIEKIKNKVKTIKHELGWWIGFISGLLSIIEYKLDNIPLWIKVICFCLCTLSLIFCFYKLYCFITNTYERYNVPLERLSYEYKEKVNQLDDKNKKISMAISEYWDCINCNHIVPHDELCSKIKKVYEYLWPQYSVSTSIKVFDPKSVNCNTEDWRIITWGRSSYVGADRGNHDYDKDRHTVSKNSDFKIILSPKYEDVVFMCKNLSDPTFLHKFREEYGEEYLNSTPYYWKKYSSTIVVPIRKRTQNGSFTIVGFLCVDTKEPFIGSDDLFSIGANYLQGFSKVLYSIITNWLDQEGAVINE